MDLSFLYSSCLLQFPNEGLGDKLQLILINFSTLHSFSYLHLHPQPCDRQLSNDPGVSCTQLVGARAGYTDSVLIYEISPLITDCGFWLQRNRHKRRISLFCIPSDHCHKPILQLKRLPGLKGLVCVLFFNFIFYFLPFISFAPFKSQLFKI